MILLHGEIQEITFQIECALPKSITHTRRILRLTCDSNGILRFFLWMSAVSNGIKLGPRPFLRAHRVTIQHQWSQHQECFKEGDFEQLYHACQTSYYIAWFVHGMKRHVDTYFYSVNTGDRSTMTNTKSRRPNASSR